jgi:lipid-A-disaccharide synthase
VPYISLVNLIAGREVVRELFGATFSPPALRTELLSLLDDAPRRSAVLAGYAEVRRFLGPSGAARRLAARLAALR